MLTVRGQEALEASGWAEQQKFRFWKNTRKKDEGKAKVHSEAERYSKLGLS